MAEKFQKFSLGIVDPDPSGRARFKESTIPVHEFGEVLQFSGVDDAIAKFSNGSRVDIMFLSWRLDAAAVQKLVSESKKIPHLEMIVFVRIVRPEETGTQIAKNMLAGADGMLKEPFSVNGLVDIAKLAATVRQQKVVEKELAAVKYILEDVTGQIDKIAVLRAAGLDVARNEKRLRELCACLGTLEGETKSRYFDLTISVFESARLPTALQMKIKAYNGASARVKKSMEEKLIQELSDEDAAAAAAGAKAAAQLVGAKSNAGGPRIIKG